MQIQLERKRIILVAVSPVDEMDLIGPFKVFGAANRLATNPVYDVELVTTRKDLVIKGEEGLLAFAAQGRLQDVKGKFDSVLVMCGVANRTERDPFLSAWIAKTAPRTRRFGGVCAASFMLAEAGVLNGKRATVHWRFAQELASRYPRVKVESEPIWVKDGNIFTSAGISGSIHSFVCSRVTSTVSPDTTPAAVSNFLSGTNQWLGFIPVPYLPSGSRRVVKGIPLRVPFTIIIPREGSWALAFSGR